MSTMKIILLAVVFITIVLLILFYDRIRQMKMFRTDEEKRAERAARKAAKEEEYFRRTSQKHYRREVKAEDFGKDYFKSTNDEKAQDQGPKKTARRETTSSDGVTIIDERQSGEAAPKEKKIFDDSEGEYVEFEEV